MVLAITKIAKKEEETRTTVVFKLLDEFGNLSGLKINSSKTEGMWIGSLKNNEEKPFRIRLSLRGLLFI